LRSDLGGELFLVYLDVGRSLDQTDTYNQ